MSTRVSIRIDGDEVEVESDWTLAAALINAGAWGFRSAIDGSPRGPLCAMGVCFECRVTIDGEPHRRACMIRCADGLEIRTGD